MISVSSPLAFGTGRKTDPYAAPSGSEDKLSIGPRQTEALMPTELKTVGSGDLKQDVSGTRQEQKRLAEQIQANAEKANKYLQMVDTHLEFRVSEQTGHVVVHVVNSDTQEVVREIPPETLNKFASQTTQLQGLLFQAQG